MARREQNLRIGRDPVVCIFVPSSRACPPSPDSALGSSSDPFDEVEEREGNTGPGTSRDERMQAEQGRSYGSSRRVVRIGTGQNARTAWAPLLTISKTRKRAVAEILDDEDARLADPEPGRGTMVAPIMTLSEREARWPEEVRLSLRELRFLENCPECIVPARYRHEVAPYAFDRRGRPFQSYVNDGIRELDDEQVTAIRTALGDMAWREGFDEAVFAARQGDLSQEAIACATELVRRTVQSEQEESSDNEVQVLDPHVWRREVQSRALLGSAMNRSQPRASHGMPTPPNPRMADRERRAGPATVDRDPENIREDHHPHGRMAEIHGQSTPEGSTPKSTAQCACQPRKRRALAKATPSKLNQRTTPPQRAETHPNNTVKQGLNTSESVTNLCPGDACRRLHEVFRKPRDQLSRIPPFGSPFWGERHEWLANIVTIADCADERYHMPELIESCKRERHAQNNPPVSPITQHLREGANFSKAFLS